MKHQFYPNAALLELREIDSTYFSRQSLSMTSIYTGSDHKFHFKWAVFHDKLVLVYYSGHEENIIGIRCLFYGYSSVVFSSHCTLFPFYEDSENHCQLGGIFNVSF